MTEKEKLMIMLDAYKREYHEANYVGKEDKIGLLIKILLQELKRENFDKKLEALNKAVRKIPKNAWSTILRGNKNE